MPSAVLLLPIDSEEMLFYTVPVSCIHNIHAFKQII